MSDVVFLSGWAGPESLFPGLSGRVRFATPFLDGDEDVLLAHFASTPSRILAGWSTGAHIILKHINVLAPQYERIILAAPFVRFSDSLPARITAGMAENMATDPEGVTRAFWKNAGVPGEPDWQQPWAVPLVAGLHYLLTSQAPPTPATAGNVTVLHGQKDRIVRDKAIARVMAMLPDARQITMPGGHYPDPATLAAQLFA